VLYPRSKTPYPHGGNGEGGLKSRPGKHDTYAWGHKRIPKDDDVDEDLVDVLASLANEDPDV